jgi:hypothetical protein
MRAGAVRERNLLLAVLADLAAAGQRAARPPVMVVRARQILAAAAQGQIAVAAILVFTQVVMVALALLLSAMRTLTLLRLQQPALRQLQLPVATAFTNGLLRGASPSDERNNGALC